MKRDILLGAKWISTWIAKGYPLLLRPPPRSPPPPAQGAASRKGRNKKPLPTQRGNGKMPGVKKTARGGVADLTASDIRHDHARTAQGQDARNSRPLPAAALWAFTQQGKMNVSRHQVEMAESAPFAVRTYARCRCRQPSHDATVGVVVEAVHASVIRRDGRRRQEQGHHRHEEDNRGSRKKNLTATRRSL